jgi:tetratricopeptide (TPR) repeat protein
LDLFIEANKDVYKDKQFYHALVLGDYLGVLCESGLFKDAVEISIKAIQYKEKWNFRSLLFIYFNTANIYLFSHDYKTAINWYDKALYENEQNKIWLNPKEQANYYENKAIALYYLKEYDKAETWFLKAIEISKGTTADKNFEPYYFLSKIYELTNNIKKRNKYYKMFLTRRSKLTDKEFEFKMRFYEE